MSFLISYLNLLNSRKIIKHSFAYDGSVELSSLSLVDSHRESAVFRFLTHSRVITPFRLTIGGSPY